jgi:hypothetical protein
MDTDISETIYHKLIRWCWREATDDYSDYSDALAVGCKEEYKAVFHSNMLTIMLTIYDPQQRYCRYHGERVNELYNKINQCLELDENLIP